MIRSEFRGEGDIGGGEEVEVKGTEEEGMREKGGMGLRKGALALSFPP